MNDQEMIECRDPGRQIERAIAIMHRLRAPGGCPWDAEQTHESLIPNMLEESYECIDAIRAKDWEHLREELGDLMLQVLFHAELAQERPEEGYGIEEVAQNLCEKLVRRHPHVFGDGAARDSAAVLRKWDEIKRSERDAQDKPYLHDCGKGLPELLRASKLSKKAAKVGFDWESDEGTVQKVVEELREVQEALNLPDGAARVEEELGDLLFSVVNLCRRRGVNPELALHDANEKFYRRFHEMEKKLAERGKSLQEATAQEMDAAWMTVKEEEKRERKTSKPADL